MDTDRRECVDFVVGEIDLRYCRNRKYTVTRVVDGDFIYWFTIVERKRYKVTRELFIKM